MNEYTEVATPDTWQCVECGNAAARHPCAIKRRRLDFVAMLRIKNEEAHIAEVLQSINSLCDAIFVFDDNSTDRTAEIVKLFEKVHYIRSPFEGLNESRDKNYLYDQIIKYCEPNWILCVDGDEVLEANGPAIIRDYVTRFPDVQAWKLKIAFLWDSPDQVRVDRIYNDFWRPSMFRPFIPRPHVPDDIALMKEFRFMATPFGRHVGADKPNLHCSSVPQRLLHAARILPARLKHYGYMERDNRVRKLDYYTSIDWLNASEDCYRHMCQGDDPTLDELPLICTLLKMNVLTLADASSLIVPADSYLVHAGPLTMAPWNESESWEPTDWAKIQMPQVPNRQQ